MPNNDELISAIREANPIESVVSSYINLKKRGRNYVCCCPFHSERTPSFTVFPDTQTFHCFGCGAGSDVFNFVMKYENLDFGEAVKLLAERGGIEIPDRPTGNGNAKKRTRIYEINRAAARFFYKNLIYGKDKSGLEYFYNRGVSPQIVKKYGLGYASDSFTELTSALIADGFTEEEIITAWLGGRSQKTGRIFDMFRHRVIFPIIDLRGNVVGFGGRVLDDSKPKYLNTAETPVFSKSSNLFSLNLAKGSDSKKIIFCEGYMDVIALYQAGFTNAVATLGTAITENHVNIIKRYADEVILAYDSDFAGQEATKKAIRYFSAAGMNARVLEMEGAKDPDEFIKKFGAERFRQLINNTGGANDFMIEQCKKGLDIETNEGKSEFLKRVARFIAEMPSEIDRGIYISSVAKKYDISVNYIESEVRSNVEKTRQIRKKNDNKKVITSVTMKKRDGINEATSCRSKEVTAEEQIIYFLLKFPEEYEAVERVAPPDVFVTSFYKKVYAYLLGAVRENEFFSFSLLNYEFSPDEVEKIGNIIAKYRELEINIEVVRDGAETLRNHVDKSKIDFENMSDDEFRRLLKQTNK